jgi:hypothetical protein
MSVERRGDTLHIASRNSSITIYGLFGTDVYTWREISLSLPADMPLSLAVGSGDAALTGLSRIDVDVGSGDVALRQVGRVEGDVGSGDLVVDGATAVSVDVGSGDAVLKRVQGDVRASVGSGDVDMLDVGPIASLSAGSGSISVEGVRGDARIASVGSGDIALRGVRGAVHQFVNEVVKWFTGTASSFGSRLVFGRDGRLFVTLGDRNSERARARERSREREGSSVFSGLDVVDCGKGPARPLRARPSRTRPRVRAS